MSRRVVTLLASLFVASLLYDNALGQQPRTYPPYTLVTRFTEYHSNGEEMRVTSSTRYQSASGDWRSVSKLGNDEHATLYRRGAGVFHSNSRTMRILKTSSHAPGCPLRTGEELRADKQFVRTEELLGFTAYVLAERRMKGVLIEHYYIPELGGGIPAKQTTTYENGPRFVSEPISLTLGEPNALDITGPSYLLIDQEAIFLPTLDKHLLTKPQPDYPTQALNLGLSGSVNVIVTVDDTGQVIIAAASPGSAASPLREAAVEAAYKATFKPIVVDGRTIIAKGMINYQFVLPK